MSREDEAALLALTLGRLALGRKAEKMVLLDLRSLATFADFMIILSGRSTRQVQSLAENILREAKNIKVKALGKEGLNEGRWALLDFGPVVVHVFLEEVRGYYDLEGLWSDALQYDWSDQTGEPPILDSDPDAG